MSLIWFKKKKKKVYRKGGPKQVITVKHVAKPCNSFKYIQVIADLFPILLFIPVYPVFYYLGKEYPVLSSFSLLVMT